MRHFEVALLPDGSPDLEHQDVNVWYESNGLKSNFLYHADTKLLDVTRTVADELVLFSSGIGLPRTH